MKFLLVLSVVAVVAFAAPNNKNPYVVVQQDTAGNYKLVLDAGDYTKTEESRDGQVVGTYSFIDGDGVLQTVKYTAGLEGFIAEGSNLPKDTLEVVKAREEHKAAHAQVLTYLPITEEFKQTGQGQSQEEISQTNVAFLKNGQRFIPVIKYVPKEITIA